MRKHQVDDIVARQPEVGHQGSGLRSNVEIAFLLAHTNPQKPSQEGAQHSHPPRRNTTRHGYVIGPRVGQRPKNKNSLFSSQMPEFRASIAQVQSPRIGWRSTAGNSATGLKIANPCTGQLAFRNLLELEGQSLGVGDNKAVRDIGVLLTSRSARAPEDPSRMAEGIAPVAALHGNP